MRYMLTLTEPAHYERWAALSDADRQAVFAAFERFDAAVTERGGKVIGGEGLFADLEGTREVLDGLVVVAALIGDHATGVKHAGDARVERTDGGLEGAASLLEAL